MADFHFIYFLLILSGTFSAYQTLSSIFSIPLPHSNFIFLFSGLIFAIRPRVFEPYLTSSPMLWILIGVFSILLSVQRKFFLKWPLSWQLFRGKKSIRRSYLTILDELILNVSMGSSAKMNIVKSIRNLGFGWTQAGWIHTGSGSPVIFKSNFQDQTLQFFLMNLHQIIQSDTHHLSRLSELRDQLSLIESFRHRSGQIKEMALFQSVIMLILFVAVTIFVSSHQGGLRKWSHYLLISSILFLSGLLSIHFLTKVFRWRQ